MNNSLFKPDDERATWMVVYTAYSQSEAHIVMGRLKVEGIPSMQHGYASSTALGIGYGNLGEITILVAPEHYDAACDLIDPEPSRPLEENTNPVTFRTEEKPSPAHDDE